MTRHFPEKFKSEVSRERLTVKAEDGSMLYLCDLRWLSARLIEGRRCDRAELAAAGVAIGHYLALKRSRASA